jgi:hypothetical protein
MPMNELKRLVGLGESQPVSCALALTADKTALLLVHKTIKPKKLRAQMLKDAGKSVDQKSLRFGRITIDKDNDPGTVRFAVNKPEIGGTIPAMLRLVRKTGYQAVVFNPDPSLEDESEEDAPGAAPSAAAAPSAPAAPAAAAAPPPPPPPPPPGAAPAAGPAPAQAAPDWGKLEGALAALVQRIPAVAAGNAAVQAPLVKFAQAAQGAIKAKQDYGAALAAVNELNRGLSGAGQAKPAAQTEASVTGAVNYAKSRLAWLAARKKIESDIDKLRAEIVATYQADGLAGELETAYKARVAPVLEALDERLADALDAATNATDPAERAKLVAEAKEILGDYTTFLNSDTTIKDLDDNPFVPLSIGATISATLSTLSKAVH